MGDFLKNNAIFVLMFRKWFVLLFVLSAFRLPAQTFTDIRAKLTGVSGSACAWIDYDRDGDPDVMVTGEFYQGNRHFISTQLYRNDRHNHFTRIYPSIVNVYRGAFDWADEDLDGDPDLFITGEDATGHAVVRLYLNNTHNGSPHFVPVDVHIPGLKDGSVQWGDFDGDGDPDLLLTGMSDNGPVTRIYRNDRHQRFTRLNAGLPGVHFGVAKWADIDRDGDLDVIVSGTLASGQYVTDIFVNNNGKFTRLPLDFMHLSLSDIAFADEDLDGDLDFVVCGETQDGRFVTRLYKNQGNGYYALAFPSLINVRTGSVDWGDFDHDGDSDLLITGESASGPVSRIYRNDRNDVFTDIHAGLVGLYMSDGHFGDYDLDGDLDVIISGMSSQYGFYTKIYRNNPMRIDTLKKDTTKTNTGIFSYDTKVPPMVKNIYYYVYASCYCDLYGKGKKGYHVFFSEVKKPRRQYELEDTFNSIIRKNYPFWSQFNQAEIIKNGFPNKAKAEKSRSIAIHEYKTKGFQVHFLKW
jgi:hypothetical protein